MSQWPFKDRVVRRCPRHSCNCDNYIFYFYFRLSVMSQRWHRWTGRRFTSGSTSCPVQRPGKMPCWSWARSASLCQTWHQCCGTHVAQLLPFCRYAVYIVLLLPAVHSKCGFFLFFFSLFNTLFLVVGNSEHLSVDKSTDAYSSPVKPSVQCIGPAAVCCLTPRDTVI